MDIYRCNFREEHHGVLRQCTHNTGHKGNHHVVTSAGIAEHKNHEPKNHFKVFEDVLEYSYTETLETKHIIDTIEFMSEQRCPACGKDCFKMVARCTSCFWAPDRTAFMLVCCFEEYVLNHWRDDE